MNSNARKDVFISLGIAVVTAILGVVLLQSLGKTTISDDYDLPPVASPQR
jgi:hypothetical protein